MAKPRKPRLKNLPKRPKANASLESWEKYAKSVALVQKNNRQAMVNFEKDLKSFESAKAAKKKLIDKTKGLGKI